MTFTHNWSLPTHNWHLPTHKNTTCHHKKVFMCHHLVEPCVTILLCHMSTSGCTMCQHLVVATCRYLVAPCVSIWLHHIITLKWLAHCYLSSHITILVTIAKSSCGTLCEIYLHIWLCVGKDLSYRYLPAHYFTFCICKKRPLNTHK